MPSPAQATTRKRAPRYYAWMLVASLFIAIATTGLTGKVHADKPIPPKNKDTHYTDVGFFDIHVCNWPDQPLFLLTLFSTYKFKQVSKVEIFNPTGDLIGALDKNKYRILKKKNKPEKRVFMSHLAIPIGRTEGWYQAHITMADGKTYLAKDYVVIDSLPRVRQLKPAQGTTIRPPKALSWQAVPGAQFYKVIIWDLWDGKVILDSKLLPETKLVLPKGLIKPDGWYNWRVHARDVNKHVLLGDFNHGSLSEEIEFSTLHWQAKSGEPQGNRPGPRDSSP